MVNLLFITNSTKIDAIRNALQPCLKVKIDIVGDFDYGLKDVFEKRPATVFIQDQIAGVTGESVARHIQMLLGASSPSFIFMHEGSPKANPIKGLFDFLIDLSQTEVAIVADIQAILKSLLGISQWDKIYIPPKIINSPPKEAVVIPDGNRAFADKLVDDFLSNLDNSGPDSAENKFQTTDLSVLSTPTNEPFHVVSSPHDQLAEMVSETSKDQKKVEAVEVTSDFSTKKSPVSAHETDTNPLNQKLEAQEFKGAAESVAPPAVKNHTIQHESTPSALIDKLIQNNVAGVSAPRTMASKPLVQQSSPADFIIAGERLSSDVESEDLLRVFEANYYSQSGGWKRYVLIAVVLTMFVGGCIWYLLNKNPHIFITQSKQSVQTPLGAVTPVKPMLAPEIPVQKSMPATNKKDKATALPTFIPIAGIDSSYSTLKPGWERYVDTLLEYRVYRFTGKIKALQVLGVNNQGISEPKLKSILIELLGDSEYRVISHEKKLDFDISRATIGQNADLLLYRKNANLKAFVVSLE